MNSFYTINDIIDYYQLEKDTKDILIKTVDLIQQTYNNYNISFSNFLSPAIYTLLQKYHVDEDFKTIYFGGHSKSERKVMAIVPFYEKVKKCEFPIVALRLSYNAKFSRIEHKDVLGSLMALGIKREFIGDIYVYPSYTYIFIKKTITDFLEMNLKKVRKTPVKIDRIPFDEVEYLEPEYKVIDTTIASNRLDAIIAKGYGLSRKDVKKKINTNQVKVNHIVCTKVTEEIDEHDLISVRGKGRLYLDKIKGLSHKKRLKVEIKRMI